MKITYSVTIGKNLKNKLKQQILENTEASKENRKEIARVFQMANRRIQNIEKSGVFSPAVASLGKGEVKGYSKFSVKGFGNTGDSWKQLKKEYTKAIAFLNQPTSTATGARQFEQQVKKQMNISDDLWKATRDSLLNDYNSVSSKLLQALPYSDYMEEVYNRAERSSSDMIESEAKKRVDDLNKSLDDQAEAIANSFINMFKIDM